MHEAERAGCILERRAAICRRTGLDDDPNAATTIESWDNYWQNPANESAHGSGGTPHPIVQSFWSEFFGAAQSEFGRPRLADIASGSGAVAAAARSIFGPPNVQLTCIDVSAAAIEALQRRFPEVTGVVADAREIPLPAASFDIVCSQFGIEYAGADALGEALRLLAPGGRLGLLIHHRDGGIFRQCAASLDAVRQLESSGFIDKTAAMFTAGFRMLRDKDRKAYESAAGNLMPAIRSMEALMRRHGQEVADGCILKLYTDVRTMTARLPNYDEGQVAAWLERMRGELKTYEGRMASMCNVALDTDAFSALCADVEAAGLELRRRDALVATDSGTPLAWALIAGAQPASSSATAAG